MNTGVGFSPRIVGFLCNWCCYGGADLAGVSRYQYPPNIRTIRVMCSGRVDADHVLRAFSKGVDGVFIGGCWLGECHYATEGNYDALSMMHLCRKSLKQVGIYPERLRLEWVSASEGIRFARVITDFTEKLRKMGPLGSGEGLDQSTLKLKLEAVKNLIPYTKLVEREKLRVRFTSQEEYDRYFAGDELRGLFDELVTNKLSASQIALLLRDNPKTAAEIAETLHLPPSAVSQHLTNSARQGLVMFDEGLKRYTLA